jgi:hypothetical protein
MYSAFAIVMQSLSAAEASDAGDSFYSEIPFWVSLRGISQEFHKHIPGTEAHPHPKVQHHKHLRFKAEDDFELSQAQPQGNNVLGVPLDVHQLLLPNFYYRHSPAAACSIYRPHGFCAEQLCGSVHCWS